MGNEEKRGFIDKTHLQMAAEWMESSKDEKLQAMAAATVQKYILPQEFRPGYADMLLLSDSTFQVFMELSIKGVIKPFREIDISTISVEKVLVSSAASVCKVSVGKYGDQTVAIKSFQESHFAFQEHELQRELSVLR